MTNILPEEGTLLILSDIGVPLYSARGLTQKLEQISGSAQLRRTVDGDLDDLSYSGFRKWQTTISTQDKRPLPGDTLWPGRLVQVWCVAELHYPVGGSPDREAVSGSEYTEGDFVFYRPVLTMRVSSPVTLGRDEYSGIVSSEIQLEEV